MEAKKRNNSGSYIKLVGELKSAILGSQRQVMQTANRHLLQLYLRIGRALSKKIKAEKWGSSILDKISQDLHQVIPGLSGFSARNLRKMRQFYEAYSATVIWPSPTAKLQKAGSPDYSGEVKSSIVGFLDISFTHHVLILAKCKAADHRDFYIRQAAREGWSVSLLEHQISARLVHSQGKLPNNFDESLPATLSTTAIQAFKDEYLLDYLAFDSSSERSIENNIVTDIRNFLLSMGKGFAFLGNQYRLEVGGQEFYIDLLFFNRALQCLVAFELKRGDFKPEYAGQLNFYLNVLDAQVKLEHENPSIGIILCREKSNTVVEYSIKNIGNAMGVATFRTTAKMPKALKEVLPGAEQLGKLLTGEQVTLT